MRVRTKLILLFCITLLGFLLGFGVDRIGQITIDHASALEKLAVNSYLDVLQMRRYEKNFLLRKNMGYVESTRNYFLKAKDKIKEIDARDPASRERCLKAGMLMEEYWRSFEAVVALDVARGLAPSIGLVNDFIQKGRHLGGVFYSLAGKELLKELLVVSQLSANYLSQPDVRTLQELKKELTGLDREIENEGPPSAEGKALLRQSVVAVRLALDALGDLDAAKRERDRDFVKAAREVEPVIVELRQYYEAQQKRIASNVDWAVLLVHTLTVGFVSLVVMWTIASIARQLRAIQAFSSRVAAGDLDAAAASEAEGEFAELNANLAHMVDRLKRMLEDLRLKEEEALSEAARATEAMEQAEAASRLKSDFLSLISHELRTPLTSVYGFANIVKKKVKIYFEPLVPDTGKERRAYKQICENLEVILSEGEHLSMMINNVLDLAALEASTTEWSKEPLSMAEVIEAALASMSAHIEQTELEFVCDIASDLPLVRGDKDRLAQVVCNLLSNAMKFTEHGMVRISCAEQGGEVVTCIADTGQGVPREQQENIFEAFRQGGDALTDKPAGLGLGLAICKKILKAHNGRIWVESEEGKGSAFFFALPAVACEVVGGPSAP